MKTSLNVRFAVAAVLANAGCLFMLAHIPCGAILFSAAALFFMPRSELTKPIPRREFWVTLGALFAFIAAAFAAKYVLPGSAADTALRVVCSPAFVVPLWLFMMWGLFCHYQRQKQGVHG
jgi:hypothetical protein